MDNMAITEFIKTAGFSEYEAKCYLALLERDSMSVNEVSKVAGIPRPSTYDVLEQLLAKGLVAAIAGKTKRFAASDPRILREKSLAAMKIELENIEKKKAEILDREKEVKENIDGTIDKLQMLFANRHSNGSPLDYIEILRDPLQTHHKILKLVSEAEYEMVSFLKPPYSEPFKGEVTEQMESSWNALKRGVKIRSIQELPPDETLKRPIIERLRLADLNEQSTMRVTDELPIKVIVFDEKIVVYAMEDPIVSKQSLTTMITKNRALARSFKMLFDSIWEKAVNYVILDERKVHLYELNSYFAQSGKKD